MKCVAVILAAGTGDRMGSKVPKQFINVYDKPVLIYTLEAFQNHPLIDEIEVVALEGWEDVVKAYAKQFNINKLKYVVTGGDTIQESIRNGIYNLEKLASSEDIIVVHDGIRPLVDESVLTDVIKVAKEKKNAICSMPYNEQIFIIDEDNESTTVEYIPRETIRRVSTPQAYAYQDLLEAYRYAFAHNIGITGSAYADTLMSDLGKELYFASGSDKNIKIISQDDLFLFKAYLKKEKSNWLK